ncbi:MAG: hypothetical protein MPJ50_13205 [Pirellulales bacterium]|nr:hypothetical protein [Pirellulales bacterium]
MKSMRLTSNRRRFLQSTAASSVGLGFLSQLPRVSAVEARPDTDIVQLRPEIEPLVRLMEETPRGEVLEKVAAEIRGGVSYQQILAALFLAGVRNVQPRPSVGFKFHAVLVVNSAHLASLDGPDEHRWLPIFWAIDNFKSSQARDISEGNWTMAPVDESKLPTSRQARAAFRSAMDAWDVPAADTAIAALTRTAGANEIFEEFFRYGARDFRSIGHKAIFVANSWRTLQCIGWQHAEPVLRSLAYALLNHEGEANPAKADLGPDQPWRRNIGLAGRFREDWLDGKTDDAATQELLATLRTGSNDDACDKVFELVNRGTHPQSIWDAIFLGSGELMFRQRGIVSLHALTTTNALRFAFDATANDETRRMLMLQNAAFVPMFRDALSGRGAVKDLAIDALESSPLNHETETFAGEIFDTLSQDRMLAARKAMQAISKNLSADELIEAARLLVFFKGSDSHDYKFSSAVLEDFYHVSPRWRPQFMAASVYNLHGSGQRDNRLVRRIQAAFDA